MPCVLKPSACARGPCPPPPKGLPHAKHVHSTLVCAVTREVMTDANPPMVGPGPDRLVQWRNRGWRHGWRAAGFRQLAALHSAARPCCRSLLHRNTRRRSSRPRLRFPGFAHPWPLPPPLPSSSPPKVLPNSHVNSRKAARPHFRSFVALTSTLAFAGTPLSSPFQVLPNGYVYSRKAVEQLAAAHGGGRLTCPKTGATYAVDELRRAFIV